MLINAHATDELTHAERMELERECDGPISSQRVRDKIRQRGLMPSRDGLHAAIKAELEMLPWYAARITECRTGGRDPKMWELKRDMALNHITRCEETLAGMSEQAAAE